MGKEGRKAMPRRNIYDLIGPIEGPGDNNLSELESKVRSLESEISSLKSKVSSLERKVSSLESELGSLKRHVDSIWGRVRGMADEIVRRMGW
jgi:predicted RNase H-like nuclease (RuvC/YqgF family)